MKLSGTYDIPAARDKVFQSITDPAVLQKVIEGCEKMEKTGDDTYNAHLTIGLAGIKGSYIGRIQLKDLQPPASYTLLIEGKGAPGFIKSTAKIQLAEKGAHTQLTCDADAQVGGMIAAVGSRLIEAVAKKMMADFFQRFAAVVRG